MASVFAHSAKEGGSHLGRKHRLATALAAAKRAPLSHSHRKRGSSYKPMVERRERRRPPVPKSATWVFEIKEHPPPIHTYYVYALTAEVKLRSRGDWRQFLCLGRLKKASDVDVAASPPPPPPESTRAAAHTGFSRRERKGGREGDLSVGTTSIGTF